MDMGIGFLNTGNRVMHHEYYDRKGFGSDFWIKSEGRKLCFHSRGIPMQCKGRKAGITFTGAPAAQAPRPSPCLGLGDGVAREIGGV